MKARRIKLAWLRKLLRRGRASWLTLLLAAGAVQVASAQVTVSDEPEPASTPERHQVAEGETMSMLAERYLGDGDAWPKLWSYNPEITNPHWIYPGLVVQLTSAAAGTSGARGTTTIGAGTSGPAGAGSRRLTLGRRAPVSPGSVLLGEQIYLDRDALAQAARIVGTPEDHLMLSPSDDVYLQFKQGAAPAPGKELTVFYRMHRAEVGAKAGKVRSFSSRGGEIVRVIGALKIKDFDEKKRIARATITEALDPIERGFEVTDVPRRLTQVAPKTNARNLQMKILAATRPLGTLGDGQLVFLDAGAKQGVEVGNRVWVVRQGDPWRQQLKQRPDLTGAERADDIRVPDDELPTESVAELRVLYVRPETSTALITSSSLEVGPGERVEMRSGY